MNAVSRDYGVRDSILTVITGAAVGAVIAVLLLITEWASMAASSILVAIGYFITMLLLRAIDQKRGRPSASLGQIVIGSVASGFAAMGLPRIWQFFAGP
jgi:hypothetical protein